MISVQIATNGMVLIMSGRSLMWLIMIWNEVLVGESYINRKPLKLRPVF